MTGGSTQTIRWNFTGSVDGNSVRIDLYKNGFFFSTISPNAFIGFGGLGSFNWTIPNNEPFGTDYRIKVTSLLNVNSSDFSNNNFIISNVSNSSSLTVSSPNGGEVWMKGTTQLISWNFQGSLGTSVRIDLLKSGIFQQVIASSAQIGNGGSGIFNWTIPTSLTAGSDYQIRVTSNSNTTITDTSNFSFSLGGSSLSVITPNGGEKLLAGSQYFIQWRSQGTSMNSVRIELLRNGVVNSVIASNANGQFGSFLWTVPSGQVLDSHYRIRVSSTSDQTVSDVSDFDFSIVRNGITLTTPNGGDVWRWGSIQSIQWSIIGNASGTVRIDLLRNGVVLRNITGSAPMGFGGSGSYQFMVPGNLPVGANYTIRVTSNSDSSITDTSDANFTITNL